MSFGFEVRGPDGTKIIDTTTWGWQFITTIDVVELARDYSPDEDKRSAGSIVFDGQAGRPYVPAESELYAMNVLNQNNHAPMHWNDFFYETQGAYRKLRWGHLWHQGSTERKGSYDPDYQYKTTIYVFAR